MNKKITGDWPDTNRDPNDGRPPKACSNGYGCGGKELTYYPTDREWLCGKHAEGDAELLLGATHVNESPGFTVEEWQHTPNALPLWPSHQFQEIMPDRSSTLTGMVLVDCHNYQVLDHVAINLRAFDETIRGRIVGWSPTHLRLEMKLNDPSMDAAIARPSILAMELVL